MLTVDACGRCGEDLTDAGTGHQRRTLIDIVFGRSCVTPTHKSSTARAATPRRAHASRCPDRCSTAPASRPTSCTCSSRRCSRSNASHNRCTPSLDAPSPRPRSWAVAQLHHALAQWERHAIERLLASPAMHVDETSLRVERKNHWIHVYSAGTLTVKCLHAKRGREAIHRPLRRCGGARLLGLVELHALRPCAVRRASIARACLHRRRP